MSGMLTGTRPARVDVSPEDVMTMAEALEFLENGTPIAPGSEVAIALKAMLEQFLKEIGES